MAIMVIGGLLVAGLVGWALTRSVEPSAPAIAATETVATVADAPLAPIDTAPATAPGTLPPLPTDFAPQPTPSANQSPDKAEITRMAVEDLRAKATRGEVLVVDVRDAASYARAHIPGALHVPFANVQAQLATLPKDKPIVTYCT